MAADNLQLDLRTTALLCRLGLAELARWSLENVDVTERLRRQDHTRRDRALKVGAVVLGFAVATVALRRVRGHDAPAPPAPVT
jgi:hypothetical protein